MILQAAKDFNIDLKASYMIGDGKNDVLAGENAGLKESVLLNENTSLLSAVEKILEK